jgi:hypothetical protein
MVFIYCQAPVGERGTSLTRGGAMSLPIEKGIEWNGHELSITIQTDTGPVVCTVPRETIHGISIYNDAVSWEIERYKSDIFDRLKHALSAKIISAAHLEHGSVRLSVSDVNA